METKVPRGYKIITDNVATSSRKDGPMTPNSILIPCIEESLDKKFIVKICKSDHPNIKELERLNRDYDVTNLLLHSKTLREDIKKHILACVNRVRFGNSIAIIKEDFSVMDLGRYVLSKPNRQLCLGEFFTIAIQLCEIFASIHDEKVLHLDIKPQNILIDKETGMIKVMEFSSSEVISNMKPFVVIDSSDNKSQLHSSMPFYTSPEQTGRMHVTKLDHRSDIYSFGATLYFMISGHVPFELNRMSELIHAQLTKQPSQLDKLTIPLAYADEGIITVPRELSQIIRKMMVKSVNNRYKSMRGIRTDLEYCRDIVFNKISPIDGWKPGIRDVSDFFSLTDDAFDREAEIIKIRQTIDQINTTGKPQVIFLCGESGIGKSTLVLSELNQEKSTRALYVTGKYDMITKGCIPYSAIQSAINSLIDRVLEESRIVLSEVKVKLREILEGNASILLELSPAIRFLTGRLKPKHFGEQHSHHHRFKQTGGRAGSSSSDQLSLHTLDCGSVNRLCDAIMAFFKVISSVISTTGSSSNTSSTTTTTTTTTTSSYQRKSIDTNYNDDSNILVLFLDNLQWADESSLVLIEKMVNSAHDWQLKMLFVGSYRDSEVAADHPLHNFIKNLSKHSASQSSTRIFSSKLEVAVDPNKQEAISLTEIKLPSLGTIDVYKMIASILGRLQVSDDEKINTDIMELSEEVQKNAHGNPFYVRELLLYFYCRGFIYFDSKTLTWKWDIVKIRELNFGNQVDFLSQNLREAIATKSALSILSSAAVFGFQFSTQRLASLLKLLPEELRPMLLEAVREGWIKEVDGGCTARVLRDNPVEDLFANEVYDWVHELLQEASYALLSPIEREKAHRDLGIVILAEAHHTCLRRGSVPSISSNNSLSSSSYSSYVMRRRSSTNSVSSNPSNTKLSPSSSSFSPTTPKDENSVQVSESSSVNAGGLNQETLSNSISSHESISSGSSHFDESLIYDIVIHLNKGTCFENLQESSEHMDLIELNVLAAKRSLDLSASEIAFEYAQLAYDMLKQFTFDKPPIPINEDTLEEDPEQNLYDMRFEATLTLIKTLFFCKRYTEAIEHCNNLINMVKERQKQHILQEPKAQDDIYLWKKKKEIYSGQVLQVLYFLMRIYSSLLDFDAAIDILISILCSHRELARGIILDDINPEKCGQWVQERLKVIEPLLARHVDSIRDMTGVKDELVWHLMGCLVEGHTCLLLSKRSYSRILFDMVSILIGELIFTEGLSEWAVRGGLGSFAYGYISATQKLDNTPYKLARAAVELSTGLSSSYRSDNNRCISQFWMAICSPIRVTCHDQARMFEESFIYGVKSGNDLFGSLAAVHLVSCARIIGVNLNELMILYNKTMKHIHKSNIPQFLVCMYSILQEIQAMRGESDDFSTEFYPLDEETIMQYPITRFLFLHSRSLFYYYSGDYSRALDSIRIAEMYRKEAKFLMNECFTPFFHAMILASMIDSLKCDTFEESINLATSSYHSRASSSVNSTSSEVSTPDQTETIESLMIELKQCATETSYYDRYLDSFYRAPNLLVQTELMAQEKEADIERTIKSFNNCIQYARDSNFPLIAAMAATRLVAFVGSLHIGEEVVSGYVLEAISYWDDMGASGMVNIFSDGYIKYVSNYREGTRRRTDRTSGEYDNKRSPKTVDNFSSFVDINPQNDSRSALRAVKALSNDYDELDLSKLFHAMLPIILENSSAERCCLILRNSEKMKTKGTEFIFVAESSVETIQSTNVVETKNISIGDASDLICTAIVNRVIRSRKVVVIDNASAQNNDYHALPYIKTNNIKSIMCCPILVSENDRTHVMGVVYLENNKVQGIFTENRNIILKTIIDVSIENAQIFASLNSAYARFLPRKFLSLLGKKSVTNVSAGDAVERTVSVLFSDIRNFTTIIESMSAQKSFLFVNQFLNYIAPQIDRNEGFIDRFIGDAVMALFPNTVTSALNAAIGMIAALKDFNKMHDNCVEEFNNKKLVYPGHVAIGIGIHYGKVMIGTIGYKARLDATVISDTVNIANTLEALTKHFGVEILITQSVMEQYERESMEEENSTTSSMEASPSPETNYIRSRKLGTFLLYDVPYVLYEIYDQRWNGRNDSRFEDKTEKFSAALEMFSDRSSITNSRELFKSLQDEYPDDLMISFYARISQLYASAFLPNDWQGEIKIDKDGNAMPFGSISNSFMTQPFKRRSRNIRSVDIEIVPPKQIESDGLM